jgi:hypothetical protein
MIQTNEVFPIKKPFANIVKGNTIFEESMNLIRNRSKALVCYM